MDILKITNERRSVANHDTVAGATLASIPSAAWLFIHEFMDVPVEKWVSRLTVVLIALQIIFMVYREYRKYRARKNGHRHDDH